MGSSWLNRRKQLKASFGELENEIRELEQLAEWRQEEQRTALQKLYEENASLSRRKRQLEQLEQELDIWLRIN